MTKDSLYNYADKENINISYTNNLKKSNGLYMKVNDEDYIILDNKLDGIDEKMALAEEIAHYEVGVTPTIPFKNDYYNMLIRSKNEFKAFKWMVNEMIPKDKLKLFLKQNMSKFEIADELGITVEFVEKAYKLYENDFKEVI